MKSMDRGPDYALAIAAILFALITSEVSSAREAGIRQRLHSSKLAQKRGKVPEARRAVVGKYGNLQRRFETIRDLGSIVRCRLKSDETTMVTGM